MNNQLTTQAPKSVAKPIDALKNMLRVDQIQEQFANALGKHKDAFVASLIDLYAGDKSLQACSPKLLVAEALRAATLHLPLNKALGYSYIVVYNNRKKVTDPQTGRESWEVVPTPTFLMGYKGYIQLAMRTGQYKTINADVVYEGELGKTNKLTGEISFDGEKKSDKIVGYFCHYELLNGFSKTLYITLEKMAAYARQYAPGIPKNVTIDELMKKANEGYTSKQVGWLGNFNDMALKTCIRQLLSKYGYLSVEMQYAVVNDIDEAVASAEASRNDIIDQTTNIEYVDLTAQAPVFEEPQAATAVESAVEEEMTEEEPGY